MFHKLYEAHVQHLYKLIGNAHFELRRRAELTFKEEFPARVLREGCGKSKWKFRMAFAMKGGGSRGGLVCH